MNDGKRQCAWNTPVSSTTHRPPWATVATVFLDHAALFCCVARTGFIRTDATAPSTRTNTTAFALYLSCWSRGVAYLFPGNYVINGTQCERVIFITVVFFALCGIIFFTILCTCPPLSTLGIMRRGWLPETSVMLQVDKWKLW